MTQYLPISGGQMRGTLLDKNGDEVLGSAGGSGTVTSVTVVTANGVSGSVANGTTTPAITITLGAITPTSVNGVVISGASTPTLSITGTTSVSGTNTGDQTLPVKATGAEIDTGTDDAKFATAKAITDSTVTTATKTQTLTNKRITKRTGTTTSSATPTINTDNVEMYLITAQTEAITSFTTNLSGTPTEGQTLWIAITGTAARAITWGTSFEASTVALPTTTVTTNRLDVGFVWNSVTSKWRCVASA